MRKHLKPLIFILALQIFYALHNSRILMKAGYINLGKTATKALLTAHDVSSFLLHCSLSPKVSYCDRYFRRGHNFGIFHLTTRDTDSKDHLPLQTAIHF